MVVHILDPRTGQPVGDTLLAAVVHPSAMVSDALSTALLVLGVGGLDLLTRHFPQGSFLLLSKDGSLSTRATAFQLA